MPPPPRGAHRKTGRLLACTDKASYRGRKVLQRPHKRTGGGIAAGPLPGYAPRLAPIEPRRGEIKRYAGSQFFECIGQAEEAVMDGPRRGPARIVGMHDHLVV